MTYSIIPWRFLCYLSFVFKPPLLPHLPMYSCKPLLSSLFRTSQLLQTKNLHVLLLDSGFSIPSISILLILLNFSFVPIPTIIIFQSWLVYHFSLSLPLNTTTTCNTNQLWLFRKKQKKSITILSHWISFFWKNKPFIICFIAYLSTSKGFIFLYFHLFF